jgi:hypothetical protein
MKQKIYILGVVTVILISVGTIFKVNHWQGAGLLLTAGIPVLVLVFLPLALTDHYRSEGGRQNLLLHIVTWLTCFIVFTSILFKIQHWSHAGILLAVAISFPYLVFLPVFLVTTSKYRNFNIYNTVFVLLLLVFNSVFSALLALNVSRNRVDDSFNLSRNYSKIELALNQLDNITADNQVTGNINEVLKTISEYKEIILKQENQSVDDWNKDTYRLMKPDIKGVAAQALQNSGDRPGGTKLYEGLSILVKSMETTPGYDNLSKQAPLIFDMVSPSGYPLDWYSWKFNDNNLAWVLIYLDGLETNLKLIRASIQQ